jgi:hypothetical protein
MADAEDAMQEKYMCSYRADRDVLDPGVLMTRTTRIYLDAPTSARTP